MTCYLNNKEATDEALDGDGWFHTGDVGKIDSNDQVWITDRLKDVMKVKGYVLLTYSPPDRNILNHPLDSKSRLLNSRTSSVVAHPWPTLP